MEPDDDDDSVQSPDGAAIQRPVPLEVPVRLGRYELRYELASGGMATVFLARLDGPGGFERVVALKCIHRHMARKPRFIEMFMDEARLAARINHPNVCTVYDFGEADGVYYIAMEYLQGETLAQVVRALAARPELADDSSVPLFVVRIVADACQGLHAAHELRGDDDRSMDVVHRDVSLQNLFLSYDGSVRVVDFGIARASNQLHDSIGGELKGKLAYMSPEQAQSMPIDRRTDVWALGVVMWEMLTRKRLFRRETDVDTITAVLTDAVRRPSELRPGIPPELDEIVLKALARDPEERYATARELGRDLGQLIADARTPVDLHELADWMRVLFPGQREASDKLLADARRPLPAGAAVPVSQAGLRLASSTTDATSAETPKARRDAMADESSVVLPARWRSGVVVGLIAALVAAVVGTVSALVVQSGDPGAAQPSANAPAHAPMAESKSDDAEGGQEHERRADATDEPSDAGGESTREVNGEPRDGAGEGAADAGSSASEQGESADRTERVRRPRPAREPGAVTVITVGGWAEIYERGRALGRTPKRLELPAGVHRLVLRPPEGEPIERRVRVEPDGDARLVVRLGGSD